MDGVSHCDTIKTVPKQTRTPYVPILSHISPNVADTLFFEKVNRDTAAYHNPPVYGTPHPNAQDWPNYFFVYMEPSDESGWENWYFCADLIAQGNYNFEASLNLQNEWPRLTQTWILPRSIYTGPGHTSGITAPPTLGKIWERTGDSETRIGFEKLDSIFILLRIDWEDISSAIYRQRIDDESGQIVIVEMRKVPVGTAAQQADPTGYITEIAPINVEWSLSTKDKVSSLIGAGIRNYTIHRPFPWPPVLISFRLRLNVDLSIGFDYSIKQWNGECRIDVSEYWSLTAPAIGDPSVLGGTAIRWNGALVNVNIQETLHPEAFISETENGLTVFRTYPATPFVDWPSTQVVYPSVRPCPKGGFNITKWVVHSPVGIVG